jgi:hypothetical protein
MCLCVLLAQISFYSHTLRERPEGFSEIAPIAEHTEGFDVYKTRPAASGTGAAAPKITHRHYSISSIAFCLLPLI